MEKYRFTVQMFLGSDVFKHSTLALIFPHGAETVIRSKDFLDQKMCIDNCQRFVKDTIDGINANSDQRYVVVWESNPIYGVGNSNPNDKWDEDQILKFFIVNPKDTVSDGENEMIGSAFVATVTLVTDENPETKALDSRLH